MYKVTIFFFVRIVIYHCLRFRRCILTNINPETGKRHPDGEPLKTLVKTRTILPNETPVIGIQLGVRVTGSVSIGDEVFIDDDTI